MKKLLLILTVLSFMAAPAFAATCNTAATAGESYDITDGTNLLTINVSPGVVGCYNSDTSTAGAAQWYSVSTFNVGGTNAYATASSYTSLYSKNIDSIAEKTVSAVFDSFLATKGSEDSWTGWSK